MKTPDRFEQMAERVCHEYRTGPLLIRPLLYRAFQRQHEAYVRLVKREIAMRLAEIRAIDDGHYANGINPSAEVQSIQRELQGLRDLLVAFARYKKGKTL